MKRSRSASSLKATPDERDDPSKAKDQGDRLTTDDDLPGMLCCRMFILLFLIPIYLFVAFDLIISSIIYEHQSIAGSLSLTSRISK